MPVWRSLRGATHDPASWVHRNTQCCSSSASCCVTDFSCNRHFLINGCFMPRLSRLPTLISMTLPSGRTSKHNQTFDRLQVSHPTRIPKPLPPSPTFRHQQNSVIQTATYTPPVPSSDHNPPSTLAKLFTRFQMVLCHALQ